MALPPAPSLGAFRGVATGVPAVALIITIFRLFYRIKRKLAWWDDLLVGFASLWMILLVIFVWITTVEGLNQQLKIVAYYMATYTFTLGNYFARLSILLGILRIAPNPRTRFILKGMAGFFVAIMSVLLAQKLWVCEGNSEMARTWKLETDPTCHLGMQVAITELVTDIISDAFLIITPLTFLSRSKLKPSQKRRLYAIFGASLATTITSIVQDYLILAAGGLREETASMIEVSVAIIVANLPVIVSWIYRLRRQTREDENSRFATDYEHARRAKPAHGAWGAGNRELTSSSDPAITAASKHQITSLGHGVAIQLSEVRRHGQGPRLDGTGPGGDVLDLRAARKSAREREHDDFDEDELDDKLEEFNPERSFDGTTTKKHARRKSQTRAGSEDVGFTVSAISYGDGKGGRRDAEYDIDIVDDDDLDHHHRHHHAATDGHRSPVPMYAYEPATPTLPLPPAAYPPLSASSLLQSSQQVQVQSQSPPAQTGFFAGLRRSGSQAGRLNEAAAIGGGGGGPSPPSHSPPRTTTHPGPPSTTTPASPPGVNSSSSSSSTGGTGGRFGGLFGGVGTAVLVQQQVTVTSDPEPGRTNNDETRGRSGRR